MKFQWRRYETSMADIGLLFGVGNPAGAEDLHAKDALEDYVQVRYKNT